MADIIEIRNGEKVPDGFVAGDLPPVSVLQGGIDEKLEHAVVIGWTKAGEFYYASSFGSDAQDVYLMELAKHQACMRTFGGGDDE